MDRRAAFEKRVALREAARDMRHEPTVAEEALWRCLRRKQVCGLRFQRQYVKWHFIADFYCRAAKLVVEVDGEVHLDQRERDGERDAFLTGMGLRVLRFTNDEVLADPDGVAARIAGDILEHPFAE